MMRDGEDSNAGAMPLSRLQRIRSKGKNSKVDNGSEFSWGQSSEKVLGGKDWEGQRINW